jgi:hypothetical protein
MAAPSARGNSEVTEHPVGVSDSGKHTVAGSMNARGSAFVLVAPNCRLLRGALPPDRPENLVGQLKRRLWPRS